MNDVDILSYVKTSARLLGLSLDEARARRVAEHLARTAALAQLLDARPMEVGDEPAELYSPLPFHPLADEHSQR